MSNKSFNFWRRGIMKGRNWWVPFYLGRSLTLHSKGRGRREGRMVLEERGVVDAWKLFTEPARLPERRSVLARGTRSWMKYPTLQSAVLCSGLFAFICESRSGVRNTTCAVLSLELVSAFEITVLLHFMALPGVLSGTLGSAAPLPHFSGLSWRVQAFTRGLGRVEQGERQSSISDQILATWRGSLHSGNLKPLSSCLEAWGLALGCEGDSWGLTP